MHLFFRSLRWVCLLLCQWEVFAILKDDEKYPTLSRLSGRHRWIAPALLASLAVHLYWPGEEKVDQGYADEASDTNACIQ